MQNTSFISQLHKGVNSTGNLVKDNSMSSFFKPPIQPKLTVKRPNDIYEQETDAMADKIMRMDAPSVQKKHDNSLFFKPVPITPLQRKCKHCEEEEEQLQRKEINGANAIAGHTLENYVGALNNRGQPLSDNLRNFYEPRFGYDFSNVKVHTDAAAAMSAQSINALAYTSGNNIVFNQGQYSEENDSGKRLMAHELTHVIQQNGDTGLSRKMVQRHDKPSKWCDAFMELVRYEDDHGKWGVLTHYNSFAIDRLVHLNYNIPSIYGDVDVDWMFKLAFIQYPFIIDSIFSPAMAEGFGSMYSREGQLALKIFWNTIRAPFPEWKWEYGSVTEEGNWNSSIAIIAWIHHDISLRELFAPAIPLCENI